jgi:hypothetical protein
MWNVLPHGPIKKLTENVWRASGEMGHIPMRRAMELVKRPNGDVWIHNAVALEDTAMAQIEAWGPLRVLLVPSGHHRMDAARFKERYPELRVLCPRGAAKRLRARVAVDGTFDELPADDDLAIEPLDGVGEMEAVVRVTSADGVSLLFCDGVFNMQHRPGVLGAFFRIVGSTGGPRVTNIFKLAVLKDRAAFKASLLRLAEVPRLKRILLQHEDPIDPPTLRAVAAAL